MSWTKYYISLQQQYQTEDETKVPVKCYRCVFHTKSLTEIVEHVRENPGHSIADPLTPEVEQRLRRVVERNEDIAALFQEIDMLRMDKKRMANALKPFAEMLEEPQECRPAEQMLLGVYPEWLIEAQRTVEL